MERHPHGGGSTQLSDLSRDAELKVKSQTALRNRPFYLRRWPVTHLDTQWTSDTPGHALDPPWTRSSLDAVDQPVSLKYNNTELFHQGG
uniref:Uncharacterized protein n=1 Tax=Knipowitschia caucasica TaxID=637954 RepID=A0AAV2KN02_KNICA